MSACGQMYVCVCNTVNETLEKIFELFDSTKYIYYNFIEKNPYFHRRPYVLYFCFFFLEILGQD